MITERVMPIAMFMFFLMIGINGFITVAGQMNIGGGHTLSEYIGSGRNELGSDLNSISTGINYSPSQPDSATDNADAGFNLFTIPGNIWNGITSSVTGVVENLVGVKGLNLIENMLVGLEQVMDLFSLWFPPFAAIFFAIKVFAFSVKIIMIGYAGSVLVRTIVGRRL